jgi:hypothetical protein
MSIGLIADGPSRRSFNEKAGAINRQEKAAVCSTIEEREDILVS